MAEGRAVCRWSHAGYTTEDQAKIALTLEAAANRDFPNIHFRIAQQYLCLLNSKISQVVAEPGIHFFVKQVNKA